LKAGSKAINLRSSVFICGLYLIYTILTTNSYELERTHGRVRFEFVGLVVIVFPSYIFRVSLDRTRMTRIVQIFTDTKSVRIRVIRDICVLSHFQTLIFGPDNRFTGYMIKYYPVDPVNPV